MHQLCGSAARALHGHSSLKDTISTSSVSINLPYRITLYLVVSEHEIVPLDVGDHDGR